MAKEHMILLGGKVSLRPITYEDTNLIVQWRNNPEVRKNFIFQDPFTVELHCHWMHTKVASGEVIQYIIEEKSTEEPVGSVYFRDLDSANESAEFGIFIGKDSARGKGFGTEATQLFTEFGMRHLKLHRISLRVLAENSIACLCYENAGFKKEGVFRDMVKLNGIYRDVVFMSMLDSECTES